MHQAPPSSPSAPTSPPSTQPIALVGDIHGNRWALDAVLADLDRRGLTTVIDLGDCLFGPLDPVGTWKRLAERGWPTVRGNQDRALLEPSETRHPTLDFVLDALGTEGVAWLEDASASHVRLGSIHACHGNLEHDTVYLLEEVGPHGAQLVASDTLVTRLAGLAELPSGIEIVACGHSHHARCVAVDHPATGALLCVNPGSVGLTAYDDDAPWPHVMEAGSPHARYAVLTPPETPNAGGWQVEQIALPYDHETAARAAEANGRADWARWLRTGRAR